MANFLPALPLCNRWEMEADILDNDNEPSGSTLTFLLDQTKGLSSHYSDQSDFDSDVERTLAKKWERSTTEWELKREDDVLDLGAEVMLPDFAIEHPDGRRVIFEIIGFWTLSISKRNWRRYDPPTATISLLPFQNDWTVRLRILRGWMIVFSGSNRVFTSMRL